MLSVNSDPSNKLFENDLSKAAVKNLKHGNCCHSIVPDHIFEHIAENHPKKKVRERAVEHLNHAQQLRAVRHAPHDVDEFVTRSIEDATTIKIYDAKNKTKLPGTEWKSSFFHPWSAAAKEAHDGLSTTYIFFKSVMHRNSIDDQGMPLIATVNFGKKYCNAFWTGRDPDKNSRGQMVFGNGDGKIFKRFTGDLDVTAHELGHGVTEYSAGTSKGPATGLDYTNDEAGGLNEAFSDMAGITVKQFSLKQKAGEADWIIGADLFTEKVNARGLRDMVHPGTAYDSPLIGKDMQVDSVAALEQFVAENGKEVDPHIGSGIPNRAFALAAITLDEETWKRAYVVAYNTLPALMPNATYLECANKNIEQAKKLFHDDPKVEEAFITGWRAVGVLK